MNDQQRKKVPMKDGIKSERMNSNGTHRMLGVFFDQL